MNDDPLDNLTFEELKKRYKKVCKSHDEISERFSDLNKNKFKSMYEQECKSTLTLCAQTKELQTKIVEHQTLLKNKEEKYTIDLQDKDKMSRNEIKVLADEIIRIQKDASDTKNKLVQEIFSLKNNSTLVRNKFNKLMGNISKVHKDIVRLNSSTPYRPGRVESVLREVEEELGRVKDVYIN